MLLRPQNLTGGSLPLNFIYTENTTKTMLGGEEREREGESSVTLVESLAACRGYL